MRMCKDCIYYVGRKHKNGMYCRKHKTRVSPLSKACKDYVSIHKWKLRKKR